MEQLFFQCFESHGRDLIAGPVADAYIALAAVMQILFTEVSEEHPASASCFRSDIFHHGLYAGFIAFPAFLVDGGWYVQSVQFHALARIYYIRCLFVWDVVDDPAFGDHYENVVDLLAC